MGLALGTVTLTGENCGTDSWGQSHLQVRRSWKLSLTLLSLARHSYLCFFFKYLSQKNTQFFTFPFFFVLLFFLENSLLDFPHCESVLLIYAILTN